MSTKLETPTAVVETKSVDDDMVIDSLSRRLPSADPSTTEEVQAFGVKLRYYMDRLPGQAQEFFEIYKKPLTVLGITLFGLLGIAISNGVLDVLNTIPLMRPLLEITGLGYLGWFIWRYLRYAETRREFIQEYGRLKRRVIGDATVPLESD